MSTLHDRIRAVVEERLRLAKAATPAPWEPDGPFLSDVVTSALLGMVADCSVGTGYRPQSLDDARHIAANDPDDAILGAEHALDVLDRHAPKVAYRDQLVCAYCQQLCHSRSGLGCDDPDAPYPCNEIAALATRWRVEVEG